MNLKIALSVVLLASSLVLTAAPRLALVRVKDIYTGLASTAQMQLEIKAEHEAILKDERAEQLRTILAELQALQTQLADKAKPLDETTGRKIARLYEIKRQEAQTLQQEFESYKTEQEKQINAKMVTAMRSSLDTIVNVSQKIAAAHGYQSVLDSSGNTNTGVPFVLFSREAPDLTAEIEAELKSQAANPAAR